MIQFKITNAPDRTQVANYDHFATYMTIGRKKADMVIDDPDIDQLQVKILFDNGQPFVENVSQEVPIKLNATTIAPGQKHPLKPRDTIRLGSSSVFITALKDTPTYQPEAVDTHRDKLERDSETIGAIWSALEELTKNISPSTPPQAPGETTTPPPIPAGTPPPPPPLPPGKK